LLLSDGSNVRNDVAQGHGFMDNVDWNTAALVLRACALMMLIPLGSGRLNIQLRRSGRA
jgi:hypothetical protein